MTTHDKSHPGDRRQQMRRSTRLHRGLSLIIYAFYSEGIVCIQSVVVVTQNLPRCGVEAQTSNFLDCKGIISELRGDELLGRRTSEDGGGGFIQYIIVIILLYDIY